MLFPRPDTGCTLRNAVFIAHVHAFSVNGVNVTEGRRELVLEKAPKWAALTEVLEEIEKENQNAAHEPGDHRLHYLWKV